MLDQLRQAFEAWRAARRPLGYIPSMRELRRAKARHTAHRVATAPTPDGYRPAHRADEGLFAYMTGAGPMLRRIRRERFLAAARAELAPRHGTRRAGASRLATAHASRTEPRQSAPARSPERREAAHYVSNSAHGVESTEEMLLMIGLAVRPPVRRHYAPGSWGLDGHTEEVWATA